MRTIPTYDRFERHIMAWKKRQLSALLFVGPAGIGKSWAYESILDRHRYHYFGNRTSPIECYIALHDDPHKAVVFDDVTGMVRDRQSLDLLKQICDPRPIKVISWRTSTHLLGGRKKQFWSLAPVLIVLNELPRQNEDLLAVLDRLDGIRFEPTKEERIARIRKIWPQEEDLIAMLTELPVMPTLRMMAKALGWRACEYLDVYEELVSEAGVSEPVRVLFELMRNEPENRWLEDYKRATGRSERSYRRDKKMAERLLAVVDLHCRACPGSEEAA